MTSLVTVRISVRVAWWLRLYLAAVGMAAQCTDREPDEAKVGARIRRGVRAKAVIHRTLNAHAERADQRSPRG